nr:membrane-anchored junction protein [Pogona vitticeps]
MATKAGGWISEHTSLKPFMYPVPETRFFHAGRNVYKFKIKYGNTVSVNTDFHESVANEELQEAIRVILGNLDNLCPFTTEHLIIFPYLNKWERVSNLRLMHGDTFLTPYPYVCTIYVELNSWKQNAFGGKVEYRDESNSVNTGSILRENIDAERAVKWRRLENTVEVSHTQVYAHRPMLHISFASNCSRRHTTQRNVLKNAACIYKTAKPRLQKDMIYLPQNQPEEMPHRCCGPAILNRGYDNSDLWAHVEYFRTENAENSQKEGEVSVLQKKSEEGMELKKKGFLELLKSTVFPPLLQRIFNGSHQSS